MWAICDTLSGEILRVWESEDPVDVEFPDEPPIAATPGTTVFQITDCLNDPTIWRMAHTQLQAVRTMPKWIAGSVYKDVTNPQALASALIERTFTKRGKWEKEDLTDIRGIDAIGNVSPQQRRWRYQLWLREISRILEDRRRPKLGLFLQKRFKYQAGKLINK